MKTKKMSRVKSEEETLITNKKPIDSSTAHLSYSFFRLLFPDSTFLKQLRLPQSFRVHLPVDKQNKLWQVAELINPKAKSWKVNLYKDPQGFYCFNGEGWRSLATAHNLKLGYFLTFDYDGGVAFKFRVYGLNTTEIDDYPSSHEDEDRAIFEAVMSHSNLVRNHVNIPKSCRELFEVSGEGRKRKVVVVDGEGRKWPMKLMHRRETESKMRSFISKGWLSFARGNGLRRGDRCVFEQVCRSSESLIKVEIIRREGAMVSKR